MDAQRLLFCALCFFIGVQSHCQLKIGGDPYRIHPYALLELESSERALLLPRLSTTERDRSFTAPIPVGMLLFNTDTQQLEARVLLRALFQSLKPAIFGSKYSVWMVSKFC